jgi:hypothetical protein
MDEATGSGIQALPKDGDTFPNEGKRGLSGFIRPNPGMSLMIPNMVRHRKVERLILCTVSRRPSLAPYDSFMKGIDWSGALI